MTKINRTSQVALDREATVANRPATAELRVGRTTADLAVAGATEPYHEDETITLHRGDALTVLRDLADGSADCIVTSPPYYGLRDYGVDGQYGLEASPAEYVETLRVLFTEARRVLTEDGTLWLNLGDSYSGSWGNQGRKAERGTQRPVNGPMMQPVHDGRYPSTGSNTGAIKPGAPPAKNLMGIPWQVAFALQDDGWTLRNAVVWHKPNAMPESVTDRLSCDYEHVFLFSKSRTYWFDLDAIREPLAYPDAADGSRVFGGANKGTGEGKIGAAARRGGLHRSVYGGKYPEDDDKGNRPADGARHTGGHERGRNPGSVWDIPTQPFPAAHFAVMPLALAERCVKAGCKPGGTVLDPFSGSGTTGLAATRLGRRYVGIDLNAEYLDLSIQTRLAQGALDFGEAS